MIPYLPVMKERKEGVDAPQKRWLTSCRDAAVFVVQFIDFFENSVRVPPLFQIKGRNRNTKMTISTLCMAS